MKTSRYTNKEYCVSVGTDDFVVVELVVDIHQLSEMEKQYSFDFVRVTVASSQELLLLCFSIMTQEEISRFYSIIRERIRAEITPELFSLFYVGEIQPSPTQA